MVFNTDISCNSQGTNANIKFHILDDKIMEREHFIKSNDNYVLYKHIPILQSLEAYIKYDIPEELLTIMVLDDDFGQPYDYQYFIGVALKEEKPIKKELIDLKNFMEDLILHLQDVGILSGYNKGDII